MSRIVGIDLDGCAYPFVEEIRAWAEKALGYALPSTTHWNSHQKHWGLSHEQFGSMMNDALEAGDLWKDGPPAPGFTKALSDLRASGFKVVIGTDRLQGQPLHDLAKMRTLDWLGMIDAQYDDIIFTADKRDIGAHYFIEDRPQAVPLLRLAGTDAVYMDRPWNHWMPGPRVRNWQEFVQYVLRGDHLA